MSQPLYTSRTLLVLGEMDGDLEEGLASQLRKQDWAKKQKLGFFGRLATKLGGDPRSAWMARQKSQAEKASKKHAKTKASAEAGMAKAHGKMKLPKGYSYSPGTLSGPQAPGPHQNVPTPETQAQQTAVRARRMGQGGETPGQHARQGQRVRQLFKTGRAKAPGREMSSWADTKRGGGVGLQRTSAPARKPQSRITSVEPTALSTPEVKKTRKTKTGPNVKATTRTKRGKKPGSDVGKMPTTLLPTSGVGSSASERPQGKRNLYRPARRMDSSATGGGKRRAAPGRKTAAAGGEKVAARIAPKTGTKPSDLTPEARRMLRTTLSKQAQAMGGPKRRAAPPPKQERPKRDMETRVRDQLKTGSSGSKKRSKGGGIQGAMGGRQGTTTSGKQLTPSKSVRMGRAAKAGQAAFDRLDPGQQVARLHAPGTKKQQRNRNTSQRTATTGQTTSRARRNTPPPIVDPRRARLLAGRRKKATGTETIDIPLALLVQEWTDIQSALYG